jgi:transcriptional regulator with GAF, ATPase, and Fis domain
MESPTAILYEERGPILVNFSVHVRVTGGPDKGKVCPIEGHRILVGTGEDNDLVVTDTHVSRDHLEFRVQDRGYLALDLNSTNGTFYRGAQIQEAMLSPSAEVRIGSTTLRLEVGKAVNELVTPVESFDKLVGVSPAMQEVYGLLSVVAPTDATVLIEGETGTGKEVVAEALHRRSPRADNPFQVLDCGAIPANLIESELFGHERGAFTGAVGERSGIFERARGGTVFLDEIGEIALPLQSRLLRVLDEREVKRLGGDIYRKVDVRLVAATNRNLAEEVQQGRFRDDLYYRLAVIQIVVPPLRQRRDDIPLLARHFLWQAGCVTPDTVLTPELQKALMSRQWAGNIRELRNTIERAVLLTDTSGGRHPLQELMPESLEDEPPTVLRPDPDPPTATTNRNWLTRALPEELLRRPYKEGKDELFRLFEAVYIERLVEEHGHNLSRLAREAKVDRQIIRRMLRRYGHGKSE